MHLCIQLNTKICLNTIWCLPILTYFHFLFESRKSVSSHASKYKTTTTTTTKLFLYHVLYLTHQRISVRCFQCCGFSLKSVFFFFFLTFPRETLVYHHRKRPHWLHHLIILLWDQTICLFGVLSLSCLSRPKAEEKISKSCNYNRKFSFQFPYLLSHTNKNVYTNRFLTDGFHFWFHTYHLFQVGLVPVKNISISPFLLPSLLLHKTFKYIKE